MIGAVTYIGRFVMAAQGAAVRHSLLRPFMLRRPGVLMDCPVAVASAGSGRPVSPPECLTGDIGKAGKSFCRFEDQRIRSEKTPVGVTRSWGKQASQTRMQHRTLLTVSAPGGEDTRISLSGARMLMMKAGSAAADEEALRKAADPRLAALSPSLLSTIFHSAQGSPARCQAPFVRLKHFART